MAHHVLRRAAVLGSPTPYAPIPAPLRHPSIEYWFRASLLDGYAGGESVNPLVDMSGQGNDATQGVAASQALFRDTFVETDGDDLYVASGYESDPVDLAFTVVTQPYADSDFLRHREGSVLPYITLTTVATNTRWRIIARNAEHNLVAEWDSGGNLNAQIWVVTGVMSRTSDTLDLWVNGTLRAQTPGVDAGTYETTERSLLRASLADTYEIASYRSELGAEFIEAHHAYLMDHYSIGA